MRSRINVHNLNYSCIQFPSSELKNLLSAFDRIADIKHGKKTLVMMSVEVLEDITVDTVETRISVRKNPRMLPIRQEKQYHPPNRKCQLISTNTINTTKTILPVKVRTTFVASTYDGTMERRKQNAHYLMLGFLMHFFLFGLNS